MWNSGFSSSRTFQHRKARALYVVISTSSGTAAAIWSKTNFGPTGHHLRSSPRPPVRVVPSAAFMFRRCTLQTHMHTFSLFRGKQCLTLYAQSIAAAALYTRSCHTVQTAVCREVHGRGSLVYQIVPYRTNCSTSENGCA
jgi:hypothetical protein